VHAASTLQTCVTLHTVLVNNSRIQCYVQCSMYIRSSYNCVDFCVKNNSFQYVYVMSAICPVATVACSSQTHHKLMCVPTVCTVAACAMIGARDDKRRRANSTY
jgi:hypothetical protein